MNLQPDPAQPDDVAEQVREVLSRSEFRYEKSLLDRAGEWISEQLDRIFGQVEPPGSPTAFGGGAGSLVAWLIIVAAIVAVVATIVYVVLHRVRRPGPDEEPALASEVEHRNPASHWAQLAERHEAAGEWKEALRCRYRELVRTLVDRRQLLDVAGRTTGELRADLHRSTPDADAPFDRATRVFELAWYAAAPTGADENASFRADATEVLDRPVQDRYQAGGLALEVEHDESREEVPA